MRFEDGTLMRLYPQTVIDFSLYAGQELDDDQYASLCESAGEMSAKMRAVRIISATGVSKKELEQRLIQKGEKPEQARNAVQWVSDLELVDDKKMAQQVVDRCIGKGYGIARAKQVLYEKRIPKEYWDEALLDYPDQMDSILSFLSAHISDLRDPKGRKKTIDALIRKGHSYQCIRHGLEELKMNTDDFPEET